MASYSKAISLGQFEPEYLVTQTFDQQTPTSDRSEPDLHEPKDGMSKAFNKHPQSSGSSPPHAKPLPCDLRLFTSQSTRLLKTALDFTNALREMEVRGPLILTDNLYDHIDTGGQFAVYRNAISGWNSDIPWDIRSVAVKRCLVTLEKDEVLDLNAPSTRRQVHNMWLEILTLQKKRLRNHRNVVKLLGWSLESGYNAMPLLVMELAAGDLADFLTHTDSNHIDVKHQVCLDVCTGLSALHSCHTVHADLKPKNILIFPTDDNRVRFIAKLADFGLSVPEAGTPDPAFMIIPGWSEGWQAPEIDLIRAHGNPGKLTVAAYYQADKYSLGLVVWSTFCQSGKPLEENTKPDASARAIEAIEAQGGIPQPLKRTLSSVLDLLLSYEPSRRPSDVAPLLYATTESYDNWYANDQPFLKSTNTDYILAGKKTVSIT
jgi:hypothetical protein